QMRKFYQMKTFLRSPTNPTKLTRVYLAWPACASTNVTTSNSPQPVQKRLPTHKSGAKLWAGDASTAPRCLPQSPRETERTTPELGRKYPLIIGGFSCEEARRAWGNCTIYRMDDTCFA